LAEIPAESRQVRRGCAIVEFVLWSSGCFVSLRLYLIARLRCFAVAVSFLRSDASAVAAAAGWLAAYGSFDGLVSITRISPQAMDVWRAEHRSVVCTAVPDRRPVKSLPYKNLSPSSAWRQYFGGCILTNLGSVPWLDVLRCGPLAHQPSQCRLVRMLRAHGAQPLVQAAPAGSRRHSSRRRSGC
jgi:hypothetical protein